MKILVIGDEHQWTACREKLSKAHELVHLSNHQGLEAKLVDQDLVIDFNLNQTGDEIATYAANPHVALMINAVKTSLRYLKSQSKKVVNNPLFGFNGLPTFFEKPLWEITCLDSKKAVELMNNLGQSYAVSDDRVGMVTPRVVCMIINEAYFTLQEGTAAREDIDMAMKLGTNYPYGPFEWCQGIGIQHVYELLSAIYEDTKDERYKICPLLKKEYLESVIQP